MRPMLLKSPLFIPLTTILSLSLWVHVIWSTHIFSCFEIQCLSHSLCQNWPGGHHGDLCFLETSCEDPHVWRLHQYAETARCVNARSHGLKPVHQTTREKCFCLLPLLLLIVVVRVSKLTLKVTVRSLTCKVENYLGLHFDRFLLGIIVYDSCKLAALFWRSDFQSWRLDLHWMTPIHGSITK